MNTERWLEVEGYEGYYEVSDKGRIKSVRYSKILTGGHGRYKFASLGRRGKQKTFSIHSIVMKTFIGECPKGMEINHINGDKWDNSVDNLAYVTRADNIRHSYKTGLNKKKDHSIKIKDPEAHNLFRICKYLPLKLAIAFLSI